MTIPNRLNLSEQLALLLARIHHSTHTLMIAETVLSACKDMEGKKLSKRLATAIQQRLPDHRVHYSTEHNIHIDVWGQGIEFGDRVNILIAYQAGTDIDPQWVEANNKAYYVLRGTITKYREALDQLPQWVERFNSIVDQQKALQQDMKAFDLQYFF